MTYKEATTYLFDSVPMFQNVGGTAYKEGLSNTVLLDEHFGHPHRKFRTIHRIPFGLCMLRALTARARAAIHWQPYFKPQVTKWAFIRHLT